FDGPKGPAQARSRLTADNFAKVKAGSGKLTEAEVVALLGPASRVRLPADGVVEMAWEEVTAIRVEFAGGKASELTGRVSEHLPSKTLNLGNLKRLKRGMTEKEVRAVLGPPGEGGSVRGTEAIYRTWQKYNRITVQFRDGKVSGCLHTRTTKD